MLSINNSACNFRVKMLLVLFSMFVCVWGTNETFKDGVLIQNNNSKMAWLKTVLDHHDWSHLLSDSTDVPDKCKDHLTQYVTALNNGKLWASKGELLDLLLIVR